MKMLCTVLAAFILLSPVMMANAANRYNMSYIYFGNTNTYYQHVESTMNTLHEISPNYFNLKDDGSLDLTMAVDTHFIRQMHQKGIKVVPFLSNHWNRAKGIRALENREKLARELSDAVIRFDLDGVHVDIENVTEAERDLYTDFVRILRDKLPKGKTLAVAVAPNPWNLKKGWQGSYDYSGLAQYSDYLMIMAYDESYSGGPAGPVASYGFVEATIKQALTLVPKDKIVLGIPFYGRYWKKGAAKGGYGLSNIDVSRLVQNYNGKVYFDSASKSPYAVITIGQADVKPYVLGTRLEAGSYTIWYENETSIKYKLGLVSKYDLKGTGSWSLGQETKDTWNYYGLWLNGYYYHDAQGHWAQGAIISMAGKGWMTGISANLFAPDNILTRAEAAVILVRALGLEGIHDEASAGTGNSTGLTEAKTSLSDQSSFADNRAPFNGGMEAWAAENNSALPAGFVRNPESSGFTDILDHWARDEIEIASAHGIVFGTGGRKFSPDRQLTRQEIAVMLDRVLDHLDDVSGAKNPYADINPMKNSWSYDAILRMTHYRIFTGNSDGTFGAEKYTTRAQMAVLMDRVAPYLEQNDSNVIQ